MNKLLAIGVAFFLPLIASAQMSFASFVDTTLVPFVDEYVIRLLYAVAFLTFIYGIASMFFSYEDEKRTEGRQFAIWGVIALVVLFGLWSIIRMLVGLLTNPV